MATVENDDIKAEDVIKQDTTENSDMENRCCYFSDVMIGELLAGQHFRKPTPLVLAGTVPALSLPASGIATKKFYKNVSKHINVVPSLL